MKQALREPDPPISPQPRSTIEFDFMKQQTERTEIQKTLSYNARYESKDPNGLRDNVSDALHNLHRTTLTQKSSMLMPAAAFSSHMLTAEFNDYQHRLNAMHHHQSSMSAAPPFSLGTNDVELRTESISDQILNQVRKRNQEQHEQLAQRARSISYPSIVADIDRINAANLDEQHKIAQQHLSNLVDNRSLSSPLFATEFEHSIRRHQNTLDIWSQPQSVSIRSMSDGLISSEEAAHRIIEARNQLYLDTSALTGLTRPSSLIENQTKISSGSILSLLLAQKGVSAERNNKSPVRLHEYSRDSKSSDAIANMMLASYIEMLSENQTYKANIGTTSRVLDRSSTINGFSSLFESIDIPNVNWIQYQPSFSNELAQSSLPSGRLQRIGSVGSLVGISPLFTNHADLLEQQRSPDDRKRKAKNTDISPKDKLSKHTAKDHKNNH